MTETFAQRRIREYYTKTYPETMQVLLDTLNSLVGQDRNSLIAPVVERHLGKDGLPSDLDLYHHDRAAVHIDSSEVIEVELPHHRLMEAEKAIAIASLGLQRIYHVDMNSQLSPENKRDGFTLIQDTRSTAAKLKPDEVPQYTIHGSEIAWSAEIAQDIAQTYRKIGEIESAKEELNSALEKLKSKQEESALSLGEESILAVIYYRLGQLTQDLEYFMTAVRIQWEVSEVQYNKERMRTLMGGTLKAAFSSETEASSKHRLDAITQVARAWYGTRRF